MRNTAATLSARFLSSSLGLLLTALLPLAVAGVLFTSMPVSGLQIQQRSLKLQSSEAGVSTTYELAIQHETVTPVGSIRVQFCDNDPLIGQPCNAPTGFSLASATLSAQTGFTGFTISGASTANELILTKAPTAPAAPVLATYTLSNVQNPDTGGTYFVRVETFASIDATGSSIDYGGIAFRLNNNLSIQTEVPPFLLFCVGNTIQPYDCNTATGNYVDFGTFSSTTTATATTQALVATNAEFGYTLRALGTTLTSGINTIPGLASPDISRKGVSQFGLNLRANSTPSGGIDPQGSGVATPAAGYGTPNFYKFVPGDVLVSTTTTDAYRLFTISYMVNVEKDQYPGIYVSTLQYVALASF